MAHNGWSSALATELCVWMIESECTRGVKGRGPGRGVGSGRRSAPLCSSSTSYLLSRHQLPFSPQTSTPSTNIQTDRPSFFLITQPTLLIPPCNFPPTRSANVSTSPSISPCSSSSRPISSACRRRFPTV